MNNFNLENLNDFAARCRKEAIEEIGRVSENIKKRAEEKIKDAEQLRLGLQLLDSDGVQVGYAHSTYADIDLGYFPQTKAGNARLGEEVRKIRMALGCTLNQAGKDVGNAKKKTVCITLRPKDFPRISICFERKLPKSAKCKIVTQRSVYRSLVCEV